LKKPELVSPAGDLEKLKVAFHFGADSVYVGLENFSLRAKTKNFNEDELEEAILYTRRINKKIYVALNIYFTPDDIDGLKKYLVLLEKIKPDGLIISDLGAFYLAKELSPSIPLHISTQANTTNQYSAELLKSIGASRIILARELSLNDISKFKNTDVELEAFVHGAMCIGYSGRCLLSAYMTKNNLGSRSGSVNNEMRSANKGDCAHSCRWEFYLKEKSRPEENFIINEDSDGTYILSSKDICMIDHVKELIDAGVTSFKIEGRMKSILYISSIVRAYRIAIDNCLNEKILFNKEELTNELDVVSHREFCTGFFFDDPKEVSNTTDGGMYKRKIRLAALVEKNIDAKSKIKIYNTMRDDARFELIGPDMKTIELSRIVLSNEKNGTVKKLNHDDAGFIEMFDKENKKVIPEELDILRMDADF
jgi:U32 family peptidase